MYTIHDQMREHAHKSELREKTSLHDLHVFIHLAFYPLSVKFDNFAQIGMHGYILK